MKGMKPIETRPTALLTLVPALLAMALLMGRCANPVSPAGGPKDETPPGFVRSEPPQLTRNFSAPKVRIYFDEFVQFSNVNQQVIISPPMKERPTFKLKGKSVVIEFNEELLDSTTYNIFFGNAIVDLAENNPATNFQYVFSTGNILDSMTFRGNVRDAFTLEPLPDLNVMLYLDNNDTLPFDSLPYHVRPYYYTKTTESGDFQFNNLRDEDFKLLVLEDGNTNMLFDQVTERIAFLDSLIHPYYLAPPLPPDTVMVDDSLVIVPPPMQYEPDPVALFLFQEQDSLQRFIKASLVKEGKVMFVFKEPTLQPAIRALEMDGEPGSWAMTEVLANRDTINVWFMREVPDTLHFVVSDNQEVLDTVEVVTVPKAAGRRERRSKEEEPTTLNVKFGKKPELNMPLRLLFNYPATHRDLEGSLLVENDDTLAPSFRFRDSLRLVGEIHHEWLESANYRLLIPDSVFFGPYGQSHDTLKTTFKTKALSDYGNLILKVKVPDTGSNYILQLMNGDKIAQQVPVTGDGEVAFRYLLPGNVRIKVIYDANGNGKWDTGHYILGIQPEKVSFFPKEVTIRANWDIVEEWSL